MLKLRRVDGPSMLPTLKQGQIVLGVNWRIKLKPNDLVIFRQNGMEMIKRIKSLNSQGLFLIGDNPSSSTDSRQFGDVARDQVIAKVIWPKK
jgi:nickel-type superoxide dismutase maturation protease